MSAAPSAWQTNLYAIIAHPTEPAVLLLPTDEGWTLPCVRLEKPLWTPEVEQVNLAIRQAFGLDCMVLHCVWSKIDRDARQMSSLYVLEQQDRSWTPLANSRWIERDVLDNLPLALPEQRSALLAYVHDHGSVLRPEWARPGWLASAQCWIHDQLARHGLEATAPITQVKSWGISCVLRSRTTRGDIYFKVASRRPLFAAEPPLMAALAAEHPQAIPAPLAIERDRGWMLLPDVGPPLRQTPKLPAWQAALRLHSQIQQSFIDRTDELLAMGCLDRRMDRLAAQIDDLLGDRQGLERLTDEQWLQAQALRPRIQQMCRDLAISPVPHTLVHGDLHGGNIALDNDRLLFFDWTDSCLAHPFFDLVTMLEDAEEYLGKELAADLRDAYLEQWTMYAPIERLRELWTLAESLGALHQAVSYYHIVESLEPTSKHEQAGGTEFWIRRALKSLAV